MIRFVVLAQEICPIVVTVWGSDDSMRVEPLRFVVVEKYTWVMIELDEQDRALDLVKEGLVIVECADPGEVRLVEVSHYLA